MNRLTLPLVCACALAATATSQVAPGEITASAPSAVFTYGTGGQIPGTGTGQISHVRLANDAAGTWTTCITVTAGLPTANGGAGSYDLLMGVFDRNTGKFTPNMMASALNSSGLEFGLMLDPTGQYAVFDRATGVFFATRKSLTSNFGAPAQVAGITNTYVDPSLGYVGGKLKIFYADSNNIVMQDLDITTPSAPKVTGTPVIVAKSTGGTLNSPTPITGPDGDVEGLWFATLTGSDNDMCWQASLDPTDGFTVVIDTTTWINNGGVAGGLLTHAGPTNTQNAMYELEVAWLLGDTVAPGGKADIVGAFPRQKSLPGVTAVFLSGALLKTPKTFPIFKGKFGLDLATFAYLGSMAHTNAGDRSTLSFTVPNDPKLKGFTLYLQGLSIDAPAKVYVLTNTGKIAVQ